MPSLVHGESEAEERVLEGLNWALGLSAVILALELVGAFLSRSLALTVDAVHDLPDILAFLLSLAALRATRRGAVDSYTFGAHRFEVFAGLLNALLVLGTGLGFGYLALAQLVRGTTLAGPVDALWLLLIALPTLALRAASLGLLRRIPGRARDLNLRSVILHLASDLLITGGLIAAGVVLLLRPAWFEADAIAALAISGVLVYESLPLFADGWEVLTERIPRRLSVDAVVRTVRSVPEVAEVHDVHVWAVCPTLVCMTAHVRVPEMPLSESMGIVRELRKRVADEHGILHAVFEVEVSPG